MRVLANKPLPAIGDTVFLCPDACRSEKPDAAVVVRGAGFRETLFMVANEEIPVVVVAGTEDSRGHTCVRLAEKFGVPPECILVLRDGRVCSLSGAEITPAVGQDIRLRAVIKVLSHAVENRLLPEPLVRGSVAEISVQAQELDTATVPFSDSPGDTGGTVLKEEPVPAGTAKGVPVAGEIEGPVLDNGTMSGQVPPLVEGIGQETTRDAGIHAGTVTPGESGEKANLIDGRVLDEIKGEIIEEVKEEIKEEIEEIREELRSAGIKKEQVYVEEAKKLSRGFLDMADNFVNGSGEKPVDRQFTGILAPLLNGVRKVVVFFQCCPGVDSSKLVANLVRATGEKVIHLELNKSPASYIHYGSTVEDAVASGKYVFCDGEKVTALGVYGDYRTAAVEIKVPPCSIQVAEEVYRKAHDVYLVVGHTFSIAIKSVEMVEKWLARGLRLSGLVIDEVEEGIHIIEFYRGSFERRIPFIAGVKKPEEYPLFSQSLLG